MPKIAGDQVYVFLCSIVGGMLLSFIYDLFRIKRKALKTKSLMIHLEDFMYWVLAIIVMMSVIYYSNQGEIRAFIFIATLIGVLVYSVFLSKIVIASMMLIIETLVHSVKFLCKVLSYPIRWIAAMISIPLKLALRGSKKGATLMRRMVRRRLTIIIVWKRVLKNFMKKI